MLYCTDYAYGRDDSIFYADVEDFLSMCDDCFGERPELTETAHNVWTDEDGAVVLETRGYYVAHGGWTEYYPDADSAEEAAQEYADGGDWNLEPGESLTLTILVWEFGDEQTPDAYDVTVTA